MEIDMVAPKSPSSINDTIDLTQPQTVSQSLNQTLPNQNSDLTQQNLISGYLYHVTALSPTITTMSVICNFTSKNEKNLIVAKSNRLQIFRVVENGIESILELPIYGTIG